MYTTLLVLASLVAAIASVGSEEASSNGHVNAWKTVILPEAYYLVYRSFENDDALGGNGKCVSIQSSDPKEETWTTKSKIKYWDPKTAHTTQKTVLVTVTHPGGDTIKMSNGEEGDAWTTEHQFVYSDYATCDVVVVKGEGEKKCEFWVKDGYQELLQDNTTPISREEGSKNYEQNIRKCKEKYDSLCKVKYPIYDKDICSSPMKGGAKEATK